VAGNNASIYQPFNGAFHVVVTLLYQLGDFKAGHGWFVGDQVIHHHSLNA
jgi:hypothetical protein